MKYLVIVSPPEEKPRRFELKGKRIGLGREVDNDICVNIDSVSSSHLEFRKTDDGYEMVDLDSTNGTRVNGKVNEKAALEDGDRLLVGETVPVHFVTLAEGEKYEARTDTGSDKDQAEAAEYATMSDKLEKLEANIEEQEEALEKLKKEFAARQEEHQKAQVELDRLQAELDSKKEAGPGADVDMEKLEKELMQQTKKVKLMASDLASREETIEKLAQTTSDQPAAPAQPVPAKPMPVAPAAPAAPAAAALAASAEPAPAETPAAPAPAKKTPVAPKAPALAPRKPLPPGAPTVKLTKKMPAAGPPRLPKRPPGQEG